MRIVKLNTPKINLDQFLKWTNAATTGGEAKHMIKNKEVKVNGVLEQRRSRKLISGDIVEIYGHGSFKIE